MLQNEVTGLAGIDQVVRDATSVVDFDIGLSDEVFVFFPSRQVVAVGLVLGRLLLRIQSRIGLLDTLALNDPGRP